MEHFKYPAIRGQIFPNSQTIHDGGDNLKRPIPAPAVTLSQQLHTILGGKN
ncbi:hypothetical protein T06_777 [Trichinella sp. T6]|nr:hypothetical protein T06_777 [Trichinella sp. T6]